MFCNKWIKKNLILGSAVIFGCNLINGCANAGKVDNLANALYDHCMKNKDLNINQGTFTKENAKNFAEIFGKMVKLTEYLETDNKLDWKFTGDSTKQTEAKNMYESLKKNFDNDSFISRLIYIINFIQNLNSSTSGSGTPDSHV